MTDKITMAFYPNKVSGFAFIAPEEHGGTFTDIVSFWHLYHKVKPSSYYPEDIAKIAAEVATAADNFANQFEGVDRFEDIDQAYCLTIPQSTHINEGTKIIQQAFVTWCEGREIPIRTLSQNIIRAHISDGDTNANRTSVAKALAERGYHFKADETSELWAMATLLAGMETE